jgi:hypothetical protein
MSYTWAVRLDWSFGGPTVKYMGVNSSQIVDRDDPALNNSRVCFRPIGSVT